MNDDLHALEAWAGALLAQLQPGQRRVVTRKISQDLRRSQAQRIASQQAPDGAPFATCKQRKNLRGKKGRIKRQKVAMFSEDPDSEKSENRARRKSAIGRLLWARGADCPRAPGGINGQGRKKRAGISLSGPAFTWFQRSGSSANS